MWKPIKQIITLVDINSKLNLIILEFVTTSLRTFPSSISSNPYQIYFSIVTTIAHHTITQQSYWKPHLYSFLSPYMLVNVHFQDTSDPIETRRSTPHTHTPHLHPDYSSFTPYNKLNHSNTDTCNITGLHTITATVLRSFSSIISYHRTAAHFTVDISSTATVILYQFLHTTESERGNNSQKI